MGGNKKDIDKNTDERKNRWTRKHMNEKKDIEEKEKWKIVYEQKNIGKTTDERKKTR